MTDAVVMQVVKAERAWGEINPQKEDFQVKRVTMKPTDKQWSKGAW